MAVRLEVIMTQNRYNHMILGYNQMIIPWKTILTGRYKDMMLV